MAAGTITTVTERGFGFIQPSAGREDVFFHRSALRDVAFDQLHPGDRVTYPAAPDRRGTGLRASNVRLVTA